MGEQSVRSDWIGRIGRSRGALPRLRGRGEQGIPPGQYQYPFCVLCSIVQKS
jgi:hypothetical protein